MQGCPWREKRPEHEGAGPSLGLKEAPGEVAGGEEGMEESSTVMFGAKPKCGVPQGKAGKGNRAQHRKSLAEILGLHFAGGQKIT